jgi:hypothetical protein
MFLALLSIQPNRDRSAPLASPEKTPHFFLDDHE